MSQPTPISGHKPSGEKFSGSRFNVWKFLGVFVLVFLVLVGGWFWFFWGRTQAAQAYARQTLAAAEGKKFAVGAAPTCDEVTGQPLPGGVESCVLHPQRGEVALSLQGGRKAVVRE